MVTELIELKRSARSLSKETKPGMLTQANLKIMGAGWDVMTKATADDPMFLDSDGEDSDSKLFPDDPARPMKQATLKPSGSGTEKWVYEGKYEEEHGEQLALAAVGDVAHRVEHDVLGGGWFLRRGMLNALLIKFDNLDQPNPRSVTAGHVRVMDTNLATAFDEKDAEAVVPDPPELDAEAVVPDPPELVVIDQEPNLLDQVIRGNQR